MEIILWNGGVALIDEQDYERLQSYRWTVSEQGYAIRWVRNHKIKMHRDVMNPPEGMEIDHINGNKLDNRRANLRICTHADNVRNVGKRKDNSSGFKGVYWRSDVKKWRALIQVEGRRIDLGFFTEPQDAALAYDKAARKYHGEFARTNKEATSQEI